jgi:DNA repair protein RecN (Recombination protein N)
MLRTLAIRDLLIIDRLDLDFEPGLNVLTGETGAGKSILLDALGFVLGWRSRADLVRDGAEEARVEAVIDLAPAHPARTILADMGLPAGDELILSRTVSTAGRKTARINGARATAEQLQTLSDSLVELHGQQDDRGLLDPRGHRAILDAFAGTAGALAATRAAWSAWREARAALAAAEQAAAALRAEEDYLRHAVTELDRLAPRPGEEAELDAARRLMQAAERIRADISRAAGSVSAEGAEGLVSDAIRLLDHAGPAAEGRLDAPLEALLRAREALAEAEGGLRDTLEALRFDPRMLEETEERLFALRAAARKYAVAPDDLPAETESLRARLAALDASAADTARLARAVTGAADAWQSAAAALSAHRRAAAGRLAAAMAGELAPLKMERATFAVAIAPAEPGPEGADLVTFEAATNPGAPAGPLNRIASGGELSRFLLALKVCLTRDATGLTLIFDEIDRGVGGATADAVGRRLATLARGAQVLVVTHSPQVAARGQHHWRVEKTVAGGRTLSRVVPLDPAGRIDEIARMLAGDSVTPAARAAAAALLAAE